MVRYTLYPAKGVAAECRVMGEDVKKEQIALQLYTVRDVAAQDFVGMLRQVSEIGYRAVELAGFGGLSVADLRETLDKYNLRAIAAHVAYGQFEERASGVLADLKALGCEFAVVPALPQEYRADEELLRAAAKNFNEWGALAQEVGLRFGYHNHAFEFAALPSGTLPYDLLVNETDPALVNFEIDLFWVQYGGADAQEWNRRLKGRAPLLHVKDMAAGEARADTPFGTGIMPWDQLLATGEAAGAEWYIVEQDHPQSSLDDVRTSLQNLEAAAK